MNAPAWATCVPSIGEVLMVPPDGDLPGFPLFPAAPLEYLDLQLATEICTHWEHLLARELYWIEFTVERTCEDSRWRQGAVADLRLLAGLKLRQELNK